MDANNRRRLELEGYLDLEMWDEVQLLIEEFIAETPENPVVLGVLATFGVGIAFVGDAVHDKAPAQARPTPVAQAVAPIREEGFSRAAAATPAIAPVTGLAPRTESPVPHTL